MEVTVLARGTNSLITRFRFPRGHYVAPHGHSEEHGAYVLRGRIELTIDDTVRILGAGEAYVVSSAARYRVRALEPAELIVLRSATDFEPRQRSRQIGRDV